MASLSTAQKQRKVYATVPPQEILPIVDGNFESNVKGIYVIGDVTGLPLVKVAANHGVELLEKMEAKGAFRGKKSDHLDCVIIGGGPAGLSAAVEAQKRGLRYVVLERSKIASTVRSFPPGKKVYSEPRFLKNMSALDTGEDRDKDAFLSMVSNLVQEHGLHIKEDTEVAQVAKKGEQHFEIRTTDGATFPTRNVIVAVGRQGQPRLLEVPGAEKAHKVTYRLHTAEDYHDKDVLIVGGGNSAIEAALMLMDNNRVTLAYRGENFFRAKEDNQEQLEAAESDGRINILRKTNVTAIHDDAVDLNVDGKSESIPNDNVLTLIGTLPPVDFLLDMGLELDGVWNKKRVFFSIIGLAIGIFIYFGAKYFVLTPDNAGVEGPPYWIPGFSWLFTVVPDYFSNLYGFYYLLYFSLITVFAFYWGYRYKHRLIWRRNIAIVIAQWTLWWGIPTGLVILLGRNPWTPLVSRSINAWPLKINAFQVEPVVGPGDPAWWHTVAVAGVVWAVILTFIIIPLFTLKFGKLYCTYICSCGALAETVGNSFRHRGPKGDFPRKLEKTGFIFILLATIATIADAVGWEGPYGVYNVWVGTFLAGALAIGLYPFLGQRVWCRMWCPLAFWMNFWGRWSKFKITPEKGKCIDCNVCNQYCQMGIDIKSRALQGKPVTLVDTPCVGCAECVARCPMEILHLGEAPIKAGTLDAGSRAQVMSIHDTLDIPKCNELRQDERR